MSSEHHDEIIAVGALGGSGTRAVAQLLIDLGIYMGTPLNFANDNVVFTAIFLDTKWHASADRMALEERLGIFEKYMRSGVISRKELRKLERLPYDYSLQYPPDLFPTLRKKKPLRQTHTTWGWKEPNTHIYLPQLAEYFPGLRYIHVLRHGLDMAFAKNKKQLFNWGHLFGIDARPDEPEDILCQKQLEYWIRSSRRVMEEGLQKLGERFYLLRYEEICNSPSREIEKLKNFLKPLITDPGKDLDSIFELSSGSGRYREHDLSIFTDEQLSAVEELGFRI